jgi:hypothetical protein
MGPLDCIGTLQLVYSYAGAGEYFFFATVSTEWLLMYRKFLESVGKGKTTLYDAAFKSPARSTWSTWSVPGSGLHMTTQLQRKAGRLSDIETLKALYKRGMALTATVAHGVAESGCLQKLLWLAPMMRYRLPDDICSSVAKSGSIDMLRWLLQNTFRFCADTAYHAALAGHLEVLKFLHSVACPFDRWSCLAAAHRGDLPMLIWLRERHAPWDMFAVSISAASSGNVLMIMWLKDDQKYELDSVLMLHAAEHGQLNMCRYLTDQGHWHAMACFHAMRGGYTELLRHLMAHNNPYEVPFLSKGAARRGNVDILAVILEGPQAITADDMTVMLNVAGARGHLEAAQWLKQRGAAWPAVLVDVYTGSRGVHRHEWCGAVLDWARHEGCISAVTAADQPALQAD